MATYLLLRDNKQSGPYTFDELKVKGLKAYDLVWIEGRSAAWRYPGEVEELKPFSPEVVEQPYDRFFRRPGQENKTVISTVNQEKEKPLPAAQQAVIQTGSRNIYVTLPTSAKRSEITRQPTPEETFADRAFSEKEPVKQDYIRQSTPMISVSPEEKYHDPGQLKDQFPEKTANYNSRPSLPSYRKPLYTAVAIVVLLGTGIFIGLYISRLNSDGSHKIADATVTDKPITSMPVNQSSALPVSDKPGDPKQTDLIQNEPVVNTDPKTEKKVPVVSGENKKPGSLKEKKDLLPLPLPSAAATPADPNAEPPLATVQHREATHRTDAGAGTDKDALKTALLNTVSLSANKYAVGTFGGISELQITVSNRSIHPLDLVIVEVQYIQANKKVFKTENIYFRNINAGGALMQEAPKSPRGVKVQYRITLVNSKDAGLSYSAL